MNDLNTKRGWHPWDACKSPAYREFSYLKTHRPDLYNKAIEARTRYERVEPLHEWATNTELLTQRNQFRLDADPRTFEPRLPAQHNDRVTDKLFHDFVGHVLDVATHGKSGISQIPDAIGAIHNRVDNDRFWKLDRSDPKVYNKSLSLTIGEQANRYAGKYGMNESSMKLTLWNKFHDYKSAADELCKYTDVERSLRPEFKAPDYPEFKKAP